MNLKLTPNCKETQVFVKVFVASVQPKRCFSSSVGEDYAKSEHPSHTTIGTWTRRVWM